MRRLKKTKLLLALATAIACVQSSQAAVEFRFYGGINALLTGDNIVDAEGNNVTDVDSLRAYSNFPQNYDSDLVSAVAGTDTPNFLMSADAGVTSASVGTLQFPQGDNEANNLGDSYGAAASFYYYPRESGSYEFFVRADDGAEVWVSSNATRGGFPSDPQAIVPSTDCCDPFMSDGIRNSGPIDMVSGEPRFMEILWMEGGGGDWFQLGVSVNGGPIELVSLADCQRDLGIGKPSAAFQSAAQANFIFDIPFGNGITTQPADTAVDEATEALFFVEFEFNSAATVQWQVDGVDIPGAQGSAYSFEATLADNGKVYRAVVNGTPSNGATLTVNADTTAPSIVSIIGSGNPKGLLVEFSENVDQASAENAANYNVTGKTVASATLIEPNQVLLDIGEYTDDPLNITVSGVKDKSQAGNTMSSSSREISFIPNGLVALFYGAGAGGGGLDFYPEADRGMGPDAFPAGAGPFSIAFDTGAFASGNSTIAPYFESPFSGDITVAPPADVVNNYSQIVYGLIVPPASGDYIFTIATDDNSRLYLSTDEDPANSVLIAQESTWVGVRAYPAAGDEAVSAPISLVGGQSYYVEAIMQEGGGGDNLAVAWSTEAAVAAGAEPIPGSALRALLTSGTVSITTAPADATVLVGLPHTFNVVAESTADDLVIGYQWLKDGEEIPNATGNSLVVNGILEGSNANNGAEYSVKVFNVNGTFNTVTSDAATLTVVDDIDAPAIVEAGGSPTNASVAITFDEMLDAASAANAANYSIQAQGGGTLAITGATLLSNTLFESIVVLNTDAQADATVYTVTVNGVADAVGNATSNATAAFVSFQYGSGGLTALYYAIGGGLGFYPNAGQGLGPDGFPEGSGPYVRKYDSAAIANGRSTTAPYFESPFSGDIATNPANAADNYEQIVYGWIVPPETGDYVFSIATDDNSQLYLSTDDTPANSQLIAAETGWQGIRNFQAAGDEAVSGVIALTAGQAYYVEAIMQEGGGGDNLAVAWSYTTDGSAPTEVAGGSQPIPGEFLYSFQGVSLEPSIAFSINDGTGRVRSDLTITIEDGLGGAVNEGAVVVTVNGEEVAVTFTRDGSISTGTVAVADLGSFADVSVTVNGDTGGVPFAEAAVAFKTDYIYNDVIKPGTRWIEAEDFNYTDGTPGQWVPGGNGGADGNEYDVTAYAGLGATVGIDYSGDQNNAGSPPNADAIAYRYDALEANGADLGTEITGNTGGDNARRGSFTLTTNYKLGWVTGGDWYNYTRDFNAGSYDVYARPQGDGTGNSTGRVEWVDDATSATPNLTLIGEYSGQVSGAWGTGAFYYVGQVEIPAAGEYTVRWTAVEGNHDMDYLAFVPAGGIVTPGGQVGISLDSGTVTLTWDSADGSLQYSATVDGTYAPVDGATSPHTTSTPGYYQVK